MRWQGLAIDAEMIHDATQRLIAYYILIRCLKKAKSPADFHNKVNTALTFSRLPNEIKYLVKSEVENLGELNLKPLDDEAWEKKYEDWVSKLEFFEYFVRSEWKYFEKELRGVVKDAQEIE